LRFDALPKVANPANIASIRLGLCRLPVGNQAVDRDGLILGVLPTPQPFDPVAETWELAASRGKINGKSSSVLGPRWWNGPRPVNGATT
jgi:hypothetical protein